VLVALVGAAVTGVLVELVDAAVAGVLVALVDAAVAAVLVALVDAAVAGVLVALVDAAVAGVLVALIDAAVAGVLVALIDAAVAGVLVTLVDAPFTGVLVGLVGPEPALLERGATRARDVSGRRRDVSSGGRDVRTERVDPIRGIGRVGCLDRREAGRGKGRPCKGRTRKARRRTEGGRPCRRGSEEPAAQAASVDTRQVLLSAASAVIARTEVRVILVVSDKKE